MDFDANGYIFPIVGARQSDDGILAINRFIGTGFWITEDGHFLTCKHVLDEIGEGMVPAIGQPFGENRDRYLPIMRSEVSPKFDIALGTARCKQKTKPLDIFEGKIAPGLDVSAFGFTDGGKKNGSLMLDVRYLKGHLVRTAGATQGIPSPSLVETSFGSPSGFSGAPLLVDFKVAGMLYSNIETKLQAYSILEVLEGGREYTETAARIYEYGLSHHRDSLLSFISNCDLTPWPN